MIRRRVGNEFRLITQDDHARVSGTLAQRLGGSFATPSPRIVEGVALHDCGWPALDVAPVLNAAGEPRDVFETPLIEGLTVWAESARRAAEVSPFAGLLVSLHSLALSAFAAGHHKALRDDRRLQFDLNKFQHAQIENQEVLRRAIGLSLDEPLTLGLNEMSVHPAEQELVYAFRLLQAMDRLSLDLCFARVPFPTLERFHPQPGHEAVSVHVARVGDFSLQLDPWPFADRAGVRLAIPYRAVPARVYASADDLRAVYSAAPAEELVATLRPAR